MGFVIFIALFGVFHLFSSFYAAHCIYVAALKRKTKEQWGRDSRGENELQEKMFELIGLSKEEAQSITEISDELVDKAFAMCW